MGAAPYVAVVAGGQVDDDLRTAAEVVGRGRNVLIVRSAQAMVAIGGGFGTLSEMALAARAGVPIVGYRTWSLRPPALDGGDDPVVAVAAPADAVTAALAFVTADSCAGRARPGDGGPRVP